MKRILTVGLCCVAAACSGNDAATPPDNLPAMPTGSIAISAIQGLGESSPLEGETVVVSGVVTGDFQDNDADAQSNLGGFYVQQEFVDINDRSALDASSAIFVFEGEEALVDVSNGDRVIVNGKVVEFFGETQLHATTIEINGRGNVPPVDLQLPMATRTNSQGDDILDLEKYEGMLVRIPQTLTVTDMRSLGRYGAVTLAADGRLYQFTNSNAPNADAFLNHQLTNVSRSIELDDGKRSMNDHRIRFLDIGNGRTLRAGATVTNVTGNLRYSRGSGKNGLETWRLMPTAAPQFRDDNPRPVAPGVPGDLRVASFNVLNLFSGIDNGDPTCGPRQSDNCRGADSDIELERQLAKMVTALTIMDADIVGLMELENDGNKALEMLRNALNDNLNENAYAFVDTGVIGDDAIRTGFLYRTSTVETQGEFAILNSRVDPRFDERANREALAQTFRTRGNGAAITVVVNHLKSKGSNCDEAGDPNIRDGQGNCNKTRSNAARAIADWIKSDPTSSNDPDVLIIGDLNAYAAEDPLLAFDNAGFKNLLRTADNPYSFVFSGQAGALDHALVSQSLLSQVRGVIEWHINADEPDVLDYNLEHNRDAALFDPQQPYRASDHDPVVVGLDLIP